jgi:hypothetical protein
MKSEVAPELMIICCLLRLVFLASNLRIYLFVLFAFVIVDCWRAFISSSCGPSWSSLFASGA